MNRYALPALLLLLAAPAAAGEADVIDARAARQADGLWRIEATLRHADEGWDHYADAWEVLSPDGAVLGVRELLHPHVREQPFTRALSGVAIPEGVTRVVIRARDSVHRLGGKTFELVLPAP